MTTATSTFDRLVAILEQGASLTAADLDALASAPDLLTVGALADTLRRQLWPAEVTYVRVQDIDAALPAPFTIEPAARELRLLRAGMAFDEAVARVAAIAAQAEGRALSGFAWRDVSAWASDAGCPESDVLTKLRAAGLDALASVELRADDETDRRVDLLRDAGFDRLRVGVEPGQEPLAVFQRIAARQARDRSVQVIDPLTPGRTAGQPTTGYQDIRRVALARLAAPGVPSIQVDWRRHGVKLAQVSLTFGADDLGGVSASDEAPEGRRRAPLEELRRNIEAAGFTPRERDGRFARLP